MTTSVGTSFPSASRTPCPRPPRCTQQRPGDGLDPAGAMFALEDARECWTCHTRQHAALRFKDENLLSLLRQRRCSFSTYVTGADDRHACRRKLGIQPIHIGASPDRMHAARCVACAGQMTWMATGCPDQRAVGDASAVVDRYRPPRRVDGHNMASAQHRNIAVPPEARRADQQLVEPLFLASRRESRKRRMGEAVRAASVPSAALRRRRHLLIGGRIFEVGNERLVQRAPSADSTSPARAAVAASTIACRSQTAAALAATSISTALMAAVTAGKAHRQHATGEHAPEDISVNGIDNAGPFGSQRDWSLSFMGNASRRLTS